MSRTINELNTTATIVDADKLVLWQEQSGSTRAITAADAAAYFSIAGGPYQPLDELLTAIAGQGPNTANGDFIQLTGQDTVRVRKLTVATYAALTVIPASFRFDDMLVYVASRATDGDGGEGWWRFDAASSATANGGTILAPNAGTGRWIRQHNNTINVQWFGAKGDGVVDDTVAIQNALAAAGALGEPISLEAGKTYRVTSKLTIRHSFSGILAPYYRAAQLYFDHTDDAIQVGDNDGSAQVQDTVFQNFKALQIIGTGNFFIYQYHSRNIECFGLTGLVQNIFKLGSVAVDITGAADNGAGLVRITAPGHGFQTGMLVMTNFVGGVSAAKGVRTITRIDNDTYDIQGTTFAGTYTSGGKASPNAFFFVQRNCNLRSGDSKGFEVNSHAGSIAGYNCSTEGENSSGTPALPAAGTAGLHFVADAQAYDRCDFVQGENWSIVGYDKQIWQENTRVVSIVFIGGIFDWCNSNVAHFQNDSPDATGGGVENVTFIGNRCGLNTGEQKSGFRFDASGASIINVQINNFFGVFYENPIQVVGGASTYLDQFQFTNLYFDMRPTSGNRDGINISTRVGTGVIENLLVTSSSATFGRDGVHIAAATAFAGSGDLFIGTVIADGVGGANLTDTPGIATVPWRDSSIPVATAANIAAIANAVNTTDKYTGKLIWDSTNKRMLRASGSAAAADWEVVDGSAQVTPA